MHNSQSANLGVISWYIQVGCSFLAKSLKKLKTKDNIPRNYLGCRGIQSSTPKTITMKNTDIRMKMVNFFQQLLIWEKLRKTSEVHQDKLTRYTERTSSKRWISTDIIRKSGTHCQQWTIDICVIVDPVRLTLKNFLTGWSSNGQPQEIFKDVDLNLRKQCRTAQRFADHFCKRWLKEFLPTLNHRTKWFIS